MKDNPVKMMIFLHSSFVITVLIQSNKIVNNKILYKGAYIGTKFVPTDRRQEIVVNMSDECVRYR